MSELTKLLLIFGIWGAIAIITILVWIDEDEDEYRYENEDWYSED